MNFEPITSVDELKEIGITPNEILINRLFNCGPFTRSTSVVGYGGKYHGRKFEIEYSKIQNRTDSIGLIGAMLGTKSNVIEERHEYRLRIADDNGITSLNGISIKTGDYGPEIDILLESLYWHIANSYHNDTVNNLLSLE